MDGMPCSPSQRVCDSSPRRYWDDTSLLRLAHAVEIEVNDGEAQKVSVSQGFGQRACVYPFPRANRLVTRLPLLLSVLGDQRTTTTTQLPPRPTRALGDG